jgi:hypothetical protein
MEVAMAQKLVRLVLQIAELVLLLALHNIFVLTAKAGIIRMLTAHSEQQKMLLLVILQNRKECVWEQPKIVSVETGLTVLMQIIRLGLLQKDGLMLLLKVEDFVKVEKVKIMIAMAVSI